MAQAAYRLGFVFLAALIAAPAGAGTHGNATGLQNGENDQTIPFTSVAPDVVVPPGEEDQSAGDPDDGGDSNAAPPDDAPPADQSANGTDHAIPA